MAVTSPSTHQRTHLNTCQPRHHHREKGMQPTGRSDYHDSSYSGMELPDILVKAIRQHVALQDQIWYDEKRRFLMGAEESTIFLGNWNKDTIFVLKYRNYTGQRRGVQISLLFISNPGLPWRRVTIQKGKEKEGSGIFHSSVC